MRRVSVPMKEGSHDNNVMCAVPAGPPMKRATRAAIDAWVGTGLVVVAAIMMKLSRFSPVRTVVFVVAILAATALIFRSLGGGGDGKE
jgi:hypothetical protein